MHLVRLRRATVGDAHTEVAKVRAAVQASVQAEKIEMTVRGISTGVERLQSWHA